MDDNKLLSFNIISAVGAAKSDYIQAIKFAEEGKYEKATAAIEKGDNNFNKGHEIHATLIQKEAQGKSVSPSILLIHAEDQLMATETIRLMAEHLIRLIKQIQDR